MLIRLVITFMILELLLSKIFLKNYLLIYSENVSGQKLSRLLWVCFWTQNVFFDILIIISGIPVRRRKLHHHSVFNENDVLWESAIVVRKKNSKTKDKPHGPSRHIKSPNVEMDLHPQAVLRCTLNLFWYH